MHLVTAQAVSLQDPCCAKEVQDRRKSRALKEQLLSVDRSTVKIKMMASSWGGLSLALCCPCEDPRCLEVSDYPLLASLRRRGGDNGGRSIPQGGNDQPIDQGSGAGGGGDDDGAAFVSTCVSSQGRAGDEHSDSKSDSDSDSELDAMLDDFESDGELQLLAAERMQGAQQAVALADSAKSHGFGMHRPLDHDDSLAVAALRRLPRAVV